MTSACATKSETIGSVNVWSRHDGVAVNKVETTFAGYSPWN